MISRLVALYTPVREDGVEGQLVSASTEPIVVQPGILKEVKQKLDLGSVKFEEIRQYEVSNNGRHFLIGTFFMKVFIKWRHE
ncbi:unnamed protein product [Camellia sinensis]